MNIICDNKIHIYFGNRYYNCDKFRSDKCHWDKDYVLWIDDSVDMNIIFVSDNSNVKEYLFNGYFVIQVKNKCNILINKYVHPLKYPSAPQNKTAISKLMSRRLVNLDTCMMYSKHKCPNHTEQTSSTPFAHTINVVSLTSKVTLHNKFNCNAIYLDCVNTYDNDCMYLKTKANNDNPFELTMHGNTKFSDDKLKLINSIVPFDTSYTNYKDLLDPSNIVNVNLTSKSNQLELPCFDLAMYDNKFIVLDRSIVIHDGADLYVSGVNGQSVIIKNSSIARLKFWNQYYSSTHLLVFDNCTINELIIPNPINVTFINCKINKVFASKLERISSEKTSLPITIIRFSTIDSIISDSFILFDTCQINSFCSLTGFGNLSNCNVINYFGTYYKYIDLDSYELTNSFVTNYFCNGGKYRCGEEFYFGIKFAKPTVLRNYIAEFASSNEKWINLSDTTVTSLVCKSNSGCQALLKLPNFVCSDRIYLKNIPLEANQSIIETNLLEVYCQISILQLQLFKPKKAIVKCTNDNHEDIRLNLTTMMHISDDSRIDVSGCQINQICYKNYSMNTIIKEKLFTDKRYNLFDNNLPLEFYANCTQFDQSMLIRCLNDTNESDVVIDDSYIGNTLTLESISCNTLVCTKQLEEVKLSNCEIRIVKIDCVDTLAITDTTCILSVLGQLNNLTVTSNVSFNTDLFFSIHNLTLIGRDTYDLKNYSMYRLSQTDLAKMVNLTVLELVNVAIDVFDMTEFKLTELVLTDCSIGKLIHSNCKISVSHSIIVLAVDTNPNTHCKDMSNDYCVFVNGESKDNNATL